MKNFKNLKVYQLAYSLGLEIHKLSLDFPKFELYELGSQMRRASKSIAANIAEGYGRNKHEADFIRFLIFALASSDEILVHLDYAYDLEYITQEQYEYFVDKYDYVGKMLYRLIENLQTRSA